VNTPQNVGRNEHYNNKVIQKVKQRQHWNPLGHIGDEISKKKKRKKRNNIGLQRALKLNLVTILVLN
jgi:hypothetical protein